MIERDENEIWAADMERAQSVRWREYGKGASFWTLPEELKVTREIKSLKRMSKSYQARHDYPKDGIARELDKAKGIADIVELRSEGAKVFRQLIAAKQLVTDLEARKDEIDKLLWKNVSG